MQNSHICIRLWRSVSTEEVYISHKNASSNSKFKQNSCTGSYNWHFDECCCSNTKSLHETEKMSPPPPLLKKKTKPLRWKEGVSWEGQSSAALACLVSLWKQDLFAASLLMANLKLFVSFTVLSFQLTNHGRKHISPLPWTDLTTVYSWEIFQS